MKVYSIKISDLMQKEIYMLCSLIGPKKKRELEKFIHKKDKIRGLIGEILIRVVINRLLFIKNDVISFKSDIYGKPYLVNCPDFHFNISHSGDYVVCAIDNNEIGIDIEEIKKINYEEIARNFFTSKECDYIFNCNKEDCISRFYNIWTLKESYIKCIGKGLYKNLRSFSINFLKNEFIVDFDDEMCNEYFFRCFDIDDNYKLSVCSTNFNINDNIVFISQVNLINDFLNLF